MLFRPAALGAACGERGLRPLLQGWPHTAALADEAIHVGLLPGRRLGLAGVMQMSRLRQGDPTVANGTELDVIAAVVIRLEFSPFISCSYFASVALFAFSEACRAFQES